MVVKSKASVGQAAQTSKSAQASNSLHVTFVCIVFFLTYFFPESSQEVALSDTADSFSGRDEPPKVAGAFTEG
eukprot:1109630-Pelagomonas_calceolata.AAC.3